MSQNNDPKDTQHLNQKDLTRAEKQTGGKTPLESSEEEAYVPDTELTNDEASEADKNRNDPTAGKSA